MAPMTQKNPEPKRAAKASTAVPGGVREVPVTTPDVPPIDLTAEEREVLGLRVADCGCCYVVDQVGLGECLQARLAAERAEWAGRVEALAAKWEAKAATSAACAAAREGLTDARELCDFSAAMTRRASELRALLAQPAATEPGTAGEGLRDLTTEPHAYFGNVCSGFGAPLICNICKRGMFDPIHDENRAASPSAAAAPSAPTEDTAAKEGEQ